MLLKAGQGTLRIKILVGKAKLRESFSKCQILNYTPVRKMSVNSVYFGFVN